MQKVLKAIGGALAIIAVAIFCVEGGAEILPLQLVGVMALGLGLTILVVEDRVYGRR